MSTEEQVNITLNLNEHPTENTEQLFQLSLNDMNVIVEIKYDIISNDIQTIMNLNKNDKIIKNKIKMKFMKHNFEDTMTQLHLVNKSSFGTQKDKFLKISKMIMIFYIDKCKNIENFIIWTFPILFDNNNADFYNQEPIIMNKFTKHFNINSPIKNNLAVYLYKLIIGKSKDYMTEKNSHDVILSFIEYLKNEKKSDLSQAFSSLIHEITTSIANKMKIELKIILDYYRESIAKDEIDLLDLKSNLINFLPEEIKIYAENENFELLALMIINFYNNNSDNNFSNLEKYINIMKNLAPKINNCTLLVKTIEVIVNFIGKNKNIGCKYFCYELIDIVKDRFNLLDNKNLILSCNIDLTLYIFLLSDLKKDFIQLVEMVDAKYINKSMEKIEEYFKDNYKFKLAKFLIKLTPYYNMCYTGKIPINNIKTPSYYWPGILSFISFYKKIKNAKLYFEITDIIILQLLEYKSEKETSTEYIKITREILILMDFIIQVDVLSINISTCFPRIFNFVKLNGSKLIKPLQDVILKNSSAIEKMEILINSCLELNNKFLRDGVLRNEELLFFNKIIELFLKFDLLTSKSARNLLSIIYVSEKQYFFLNKNVIYSISYLNSININILYTKARDNINFSVNDLIKYFALFPFKIYQARNIENVMLIKQIFFYVKLSEESLDARCLLLKSLFVTIIKQNIDCKKFGFFQFYLQRSLFAFKSNLNLILNEKSQINHLGIYLFLMITNLVEGINEMEKLITEIKAKEIETTNVKRICEEIINDFPEKITNFLCYVNLELFCSIE